MKNKRYAIRPIREADLGDLYRLLSDPLVMKYLEVPYSMKQSKRFLQEAGLSDPPLIYAAECDGRFAGYVIYHDFDETAMEIGWVLFPEHWNKGAASVLTEQLIEKALNEGKDVVIECDTNQKVTEHIAEKFGFRYIKETDDLKLFRLSCE
ncbi:MAG: GNAT family N-acetyltransferase [Erysipelotrichaceae bacterium]|nr:GNAT family N-acetyltransferase [Erysipelotrichaceae bacterium]